MTADLPPAALHALAAEQAHGGARRGPCACGTRTLAHDPADATVVRHGRTVTKAHAPGTALADLTARVAVATGLPHVLLPPLAGPAHHHDRLVTHWPHGTPVDPNSPSAAPWEEAAALLARLHLSPPAARLPAMRGPAKAARAVTRLRLCAPPTSAAAPVLGAWATLPAWARAEEPMSAGFATLCHSDFHLGQLVRHPSPGGSWLLIDVDDLGVGAPAWDLARPAAWYACGLLPPDEWAEFLAAYRAADGPAVPPAGDPWPALDVPARALTVQTAALAVAKAAAANRPLDDVERAVVDACARIAETEPELTAMPAK